jgi:hypothetical protein
MWIGCCYFYTEDDVKRIAEWGNLPDTYVWEERICERLDVVMARRALKMYGIKHPTYKEMADYLNGEPVT